MAPTEFVAKLFNRLLSEQDRYSTRVVAALSSSCDDRILKRTAKELSWRRRQIKFRIVKSNERAHGKVEVIVRVKAGLGLKEQEKKYILKPRGSTWTVVNVLDKCWSCYDTGKCTWCSGTGKDNLGAGRCTFCKGTKLCDLCKGKVWELSTPERVV